MIELPIRDFLEIPYDLAKILVCYVEMSDAHAAGMIKERYSVEITVDEAIAIKSFFSTEDDLFKELLKAYPSETPKGRKLHSNQKTCKAIYEATVRGDRLLHDKIISALKKDLAVRRSSDRLEFVLSLENWLRKEDWNLYMTDTKINTGTFNTGKLL